MANTIPTEFMPFVTGALGTGRYIQEGGQTTAPYLRGVSDLASNHNWLLARSGHVQVNQAGFATIAYTVAGGAIPFAEYPYRIPRLSDRSELIIHVTGSASVGTFQVRAITSAGTSAWTTGIASGTATIIAAATPSDHLDPSEYVTLEFQMSTDGNFSVTLVQAYSRAYTGTLDALSAVGAPYQSTCVPQDIDQYDENRALSVTQMRDLVAGNNAMFLGNVRALVNWCVWTNYKNLNTFDGGYRVPRVSGRVQTVPVTQFMVTQREGTRAIEINTRARVDNYSGGGGPGVVAMGFGSDTPYYKNVTASTSDWMTVGTISGRDYPSSGQRHYLTLRGKGANTATEDLYIHAVAVFDIPLL